MNENYIIANRTDVGKARQVNEDCMVTFDSPNGRVIVVCDGMGGQAAGDVASRLACDIITDILTNNLFQSPTEAITRACVAANQGIIHRASQNPELGGMGSTCVMILIKDGLVYYGWIGDSRIYYISNGVIRQISRDQSYVQQLVDAGQITAAEAEHHPQKNEILNALGLPTMTPPELCVTPITPEPGSVFLLCSDGLTGMVDNNTIATIVSAGDLTLQRKADKLVDRANANGGLDNITVQLVQFGGKAVAAGKQSNMKLYLYGAIVAILVALGAICYILFGGKKEDPNPKPIQTTAPAKRTTQPQQQQQQTAPATPQTTPHKKENKGKKNPPKQNNRSNAVDRKFGVEESGQQTPPPPPQTDTHSIKDKLNDK